jgi:hypothetical protein
MRGGTSKGVFFLREHLPADRAAWDAILLRAVGSPDPFRRQIDGLGSGTSSTSKAVIVGRSSRPDCDVDYLSAQVGIDAEIVDYSGNCGNLTGAVGPFAIEEGLVAATGDLTTVRLWQENTQSRIVARVPTRDGRPLVDGGFVVKGVPNPGAEIRLDFVDPGGTVTGATLPTGRPTDRLLVPGRPVVAASLIDAGNPVVVVRADDLGLTGTERPEDLDRREDVMQWLEALRAHAAVAMGLASTPQEAATRRPATPKIAVVGNPAAYTTAAGDRVAASDTDIVVRTLSMGKTHRSIPGTGAVAIAVAASIPGTVAHAAMHHQGSAGAADGAGVPAVDIRIGHPAGVLAVGAAVRHVGGRWVADRVTLSRSARLLMKGTLALPASVARGIAGAAPATEPSARAESAPAMQFAAASQFAAAMTAAPSPQVPVRAVLMRGGTSRGVFFRRQDIPGPGALRDRLIQRVFGSPDPYGAQIDGLGGALSTTSKVVVVGPSSEPDCDVDYFFGQVDITRPLVDYTGSCGNLSAAVGPFAIDEGLVAATGAMTTVRIWQVNTKKRIIAHVPTEAGTAAVDGAFTIDGVPFPGARIQLDNLDPGGTLTGGLLPTGSAVDVLDVPGLGRIETTLVDASNPVVIVRASDLGLRGDELAEDVDAHPELLRKIEAIRACGAVAMGLAASAEEATRRRPGTPKITFVAEPRAYRTQRGTSVASDDVTLLSRIMSMGTLHRTHAATGAVAVAAAALVRGSIAYAVARRATEGPEQEVRIGHPSGVLPVGARVVQANGRWVCEKGITYRTARRLMEGWAFVPASVVAEPSLSHSDHLMPKGARP